MENPVLLSHKKESNDKNETVYCRILHLSDLHLSVNSKENEFDNFCYGTGAHNSEIDESLSDVDEILKKYGIRGYLKQKPVDCIVITGDFTNRGDFSAANIQYMKEKITDLYRVCAEAGSWKYNSEQWHAGLPMDRLFYCAGNHDLLRDAVCYDPQSGKYITRQDVVRELVKQQNLSGSTGCLLRDNKVRFSLLTTSTFGPFFEMIESLRKGSEKKQDINALEGSVFRLKGEKGSGNPDICFAAVNTALLAGNVDSVSPEMVQTSWLRMQTAVDPQERCQATKDYYDLIQKQTGRVINDDGKMYFPSRETLDRLREEMQKSSNYIGIMLGHHNYTLLCENAQKAFNGFVQECEIDLYLCGHTHRPEKNRVATNVLYPRIRNFPIFVSSGAFFHRTDYYSLLGFSMHTILQTNEDCYFCQSENIVYSRLQQSWINVNIDSPGTPKRFKMEVSKPGAPTASASATLQPEDNKVDDEGKMETNPLSVPDMDNRKEIPHSDPEMGKRTLNEEGVEYNESSEEENPLKDLKDKEPDKIPDKYSSLKYFPPILPDNGLMDSKNRRKR